MNGLIALTGYSRSHCLQTLQDLERTRWKRKLINRKSVQLTNEGIDVYRYAQRVLETLEDEPFSVQHRSLRVGTSNRVMTGYLGPRIRDFLQETRGIEVNLELSEDHGDQMLEKLRRSEIDIAIGVLPQNVPTAGLVGQPLGAPLPMVLIAAQPGHQIFDQKLLESGYQVTFNDLIDTRVCYIRQDRNGALARLPRPRKGSRIVVDNYASVVSVVQCQMAVGLVLDLALPGDVLKFPLDAADRPQSRQLSLWTRQGEEPSEIAKRFIRVVLDDGAGR
jgi:DNA-binding transcriptional LysR family regulator